MKRERADAGALQGMAAVPRPADPGTDDRVATEQAGALAIAEDLREYTRRDIIEAAGGAGAGAPGAPLPLKL